MHHIFKKFYELRRILRAISLIILALSALPAYSASKPMLVLGDSLSAEYGLVRGTGWVPLLQARLQQQKIDIPIINASISGETTIGGRTRLPNLLAKYNPSIVVIELGANDGLRGLSLATAAANLKTMITETKKAHAKVLLVGMRIPPNYGPDYTNQFAEMYSKVAKETHVPFLPFFFQDIASKPELFQADQLHPTAQAQPILLHTIWPYLKPLLVE
jgi:acyl-CoA thioesterase-1